MTFWISWDELSNLLPWTWSQGSSHPDSKEKTASVTHHGLYKFNVMPFGLKNALAIFQCLMHLVLQDLSPDEDDSDFVSGYIDDILIFSETTWST